MSVFVLGSYVSANCLYVEHLPAGGESLAAQSLQVECGGKGLNLAVGLRRLGLEVDVLLAAGHDTAGSALLRLLQAEGLDVRWVIRAGQHSGFGVGLIAPDGSNNIVIYPGANSLLTVHHVEAAAATLTGTRLVCAQFEIPQAPVLAAFRWARSHAIKTLLNPSPWQALQPELLALTDILVVNESEAEFFLGLVVGGRSVGEWLSVLAGYEWSGEWLVVTLMERGCVVLSHEAGQPQTFHVPAYTIQVLDPTGAGDAFAVGLGYAYLQQWPLLKSLQFANACGALVASCKGVLPALPSIHQVLDFMHRAGEILPGTPQPADRLKESHLAQQAMQNGDGHNGKQHGQHGGSHDQ